MISIAIPCYEFHGQGTEVLECALKSIDLQHYRDFEVVISDNSIDDEIFNLCETWSDHFRIRYFRNEVGRGSAAMNTGNSIRLCEGEFIKLLCQDDYLFDKNALEKTLIAFEQDINWLASAYLHTKDKLNYYKYHLPQMNSRLFIDNTIGTPSCVTLRNLKDMPIMDSLLNYYYDCDFYYRFAAKFGPPKIITDVTIANVIWDNSLTTMLSDEVKEKERLYLLEKNGG